MGELVEVYRGNVFCDSQVVADKFGYRHPHVIKVIQKLMADLSMVKGDGLDTLKFTETEREYRGQKYKAFLMDRKSFSLLAMRFTGVKALEWQIKFNEAFYLMEKQLLIEASNRANLEWVTQRNQGKIARKNETDTLKDFVEYATSQGSQKAQFYYKHFTLATYKCLKLIEMEKPKLRDTLNVMELSQLMIAEHIADASIRKHMEAKEHYKSIYTLVKQDLDRFADSMMIGQTKQLSV